MFLTFHNGFILKQASEKGACANKRTVLNLLNLFVILNLGKQNIFLSLRKKNCYCF